MALNGALVGAPVFGTTKFGNGLVGLNDTNYVILPTGSWPTIPALTIEAWLAIQGNSVAVAISTEWWFGMQSNGNFAVAMCGVALDSGIRINNGVFHHCAFTIFGSVLTTFVDGLQGNSAPISYLAPTLQPVLGRYAAVTGFPWKGFIDEVAIWNIAKYSGPYVVPSAPYTGSEAGLFGLYHLEADATNSQGAAAPVVTSSNGAIDPSSPAILYSPFNWNVTSGYAGTINTGAYFRTIFSGTSLTLLINTTPNLPPFPTLWVRIDSQPWVKYSLSAGSPPMAVATGLLPGKHSVEVLVRASDVLASRWINAQTIVQITGLLLDPGATLTAPVRRTRNILIYGDSITEGVNTVNTASNLDLDRDDVLACYSYAIATAVDAEVGIVAFGGSGVDNFSIVPALTASYNYLSGSQSYNNYSGWVPRSFTSPAPDLVIYNEGTNDQGNITQGMLSVVTGILGSAPNSKHLLLNPFNGTHTTDLQAVVAAMGNPNVIYQSTTGWFNPADSVDGLHPYGYSSVYLIAPRLFPIINALLPASSLISTATSEEPSGSASSALYAFR